MTGEKHFTYENFSAGVLIIFGTFTLSPYDQSFTNNPKLYAPMLIIVSNQMFWGAFYCALGLLGVYFNYRNRKIAALIMGATYMFFASLFFFGDYNSRAWAYYGFISLFDLVHWRGFTIKGRT